MVFIQSSVLLSLHASLSRSVTGKKKKKMNETHIHTHAEVYLNLQLGGTMCPLEDDLFKMIKNTVRSRAHSAKLVRVDLFDVNLCMHFWQDKKAIRNYKWHNSASLYFRTQECSNYSDGADAIKSPVSSSASPLFVRRDRLKFLCLPLILQNKQSRAELEPWLKNQQILDRTWAHGPRGRIGFCGKGESARLKNEGWTSKGGRGGEGKGGARGAEVWTLGRQSSLS